MSLVSCRWFSWNAVGTVQEMRVVLRQQQEVCLLCVALYEKMKRYFQFLCGSSMWCVKGGGPELQRVSNEAPLEPADDDVQCCQHARVTEAMFLTMPCLCCRESHSAWRRPGFLPLELTWSRASTSLTEGTSSFHLQHWWPSAVEFAVSLIMWMMFHCCRRK